MPPFKLPSLSKLPFLFTTMEDGEIFTRKYHVVVSREGQITRKKVTKLQISWDFSKDFLIFLRFFSRFLGFWGFFQDFFQDFSKIFGIFEVLEIFFEIFEIFFWGFYNLREKCDKDFFWVICLGITFLATYRNLLQFQQKLSDMWRSGKWRLLQEF